MNYKNHSYITRYEILTLPDEESWKAIPMKYFAKVGGLSAFNSNVKSKDFKGLDYIKTKFWREDFEVWLEYTHDPKYNTIHQNDTIMNNTNMQ